MPTRRAGVFMAIIGTALVCVAAAQAHQTASNNRVAVTMHVTPDDEPIVGETALILVPRVKARPGTFAWTTCRCTLKVTSSSGEVLLNGRALSRNEFVFPEAGAYRIDFAGRAKRNGRWVKFKVWFAIRANEAPE
jgi:hypothetical protein